MKVALFTVHLIEPIYILEQKTSPVYVGKQLI